MADDTATDDPCPSRISTMSQVDQSQNYRPHDHTRQRVCERVIEEVQWSDHRIPGRDPNVLDPEKQEDGPQEINELSRNEHRAQRCLRSYLLCRQSDGEMTDEQVFPL